jgi:hypothetical protein
MSNSKKDAECTDHSLASDSFNRKRSEKGIILGRPFFTWVSHYVNFAKLHSITYDMMPELENNCQHLNYTNIMRVIFSKKLQEFRSKGKKNGRTFVLKIVWRCFRKEILISLILVSTIKFLDYSTSFFIQKILQIKDSYEPGDYFWAFVLLSSAMLILKVINTITSENVNYYLVL